MDPFSAPERQNFPAFSPVFNGRAPTPSSSEKHGGFRWSIDELARLKPAEIHTDPTTLAETNGHSPGNDAEAQKAIDQFFSQRTILPSPWTGTKTAAAREARGAGGPGGAARQKSSLAQKRVTFSPLPPATAFIRDDDSFTQSCELKHSNSTDVSTQTPLTIPIDCDLAKLLGPSFCYHSPDHATLPLSEEQQPQLSSKSGEQANSSLRRKLFGQPERDEEGGGRGVKGEPSMDLQSPRLSPVSCDTIGLADNPLTGPSFVAVGNRLSSTPLLHSPCIGKGVEPGFENPAHSSMLLSTPCKELPGLSPIASDLVDHRPPPFACTPTPSKNPASSRGKFAPATPLLSPITISTKATSTPNGAACKRELSVSPFASPVLKHPCTSHPDDDEEEEEAEEEEEEEKEKEVEGKGKVEHFVQANSANEDTEEDDIAQPLSLADLKTQTEDDLTDITPATTCTSYFTHLGLEEGELRPALMSWQPPIHSTMLDSQRPQPNAAPMNIPSIRFVPPQPQPPPTTTTSSSVIAADSGVAASHDSNTTSGFTCSSNDFGLTKSTSSSLPPADTSPNRVEGTVAAKHGSSRGGYLKIGRHHLDLPTMQERKNSRPRYVDYDSGLVFSPDGAASAGNVASQASANMFADEFQAATFIPLRITGPVTPHPAAVKSHAAPSSSSSTPHYRGSTPRVTPTRLPAELSSHPSRISSRAGFPSSVLPSRLKLSPSLSPSHLHAYGGPVFEGGPLYANGVSLAAANFSTPPSRYSRLRLTSKLLGSKSSFANLTDEVLRKKENLKARLQLNCPVSSPSGSLSPSHMISSPAHMTPLQELPLMNQQINSSIPFSPTFA